MNTNSLPIVKSVARELVYFGRRVRVVANHHDSNPYGLRTVRFEWIDEADSRNGGYPAGTIVRKLMSGDGRVRLDDPRVLTILDEEVTLP